MQPVHLLNPPPGLRTIFRMKDSLLVHDEHGRSFASGDSGLSPRSSQYRQQTSLQQRPSTSLGTFGGCQIRQQQQ
jgi:hypothetical protein